MKTQKGGIPFKTVLVFFVGGKIKMLFLFINEYTKRWSTIQNSTCVLCRGEDKDVISFSTVHTPKKYGGFGMDPNCHHTIVVLKHLDQSFSSRNAC